MTPESFQSLVDELNQRKKQCDTLAQQSAMDYVKSGSDSDRDKSKSHARHAEIWNEARILVGKHYQ